jgi:hypothetical protein
MAVPTVSDALRASLPTASDVIRALPQISDLFTGAAIAKPKKTKAELEELIRQRAADLIQHFDISFEIYAGEDGGVWTCMPVADVVPGEGNIFGPFFAIVNELQREYDLAPGSEMQGLPFANNSTDTITPPGHSARRRSMAGETSGETRVFPPLGVTAPPPSARVAINPRDMFYDANPQLIGRDGFHDAYPSSAYAHHRIAQEQELRHRRQSAATASAAPALQPTGGAASGPAVSNEVAAGMRIDPIYSLPPQSGETAQTSQRLSTNPADIRDAATALNVAVKGEIERMRGTNDPDRTHAEAPLIDFLQHVSAELGRLVDALDRLIDAQKAGSADEPILKGQAAEIAHKLHAEFADWATTNRDSIKNYLGSWSLMFATVSFMHACGVDYPTAGAIAAAAKWMFSKKD